LIASIGLIVVLSTSATKLSWYSAPSLPFLAVITGIGVALVINFIFGSSSKALALSQKSYIGLFLIMLAAPCYYKIIDKNLHTVEHPWDVVGFRIGYYIKHKEAIKESLDGYKIIKDDNAHRLLMCHIRKLADMGQRVELVAPSELKSGDKVIVHDWGDKTSVSALFEHKTLETYQNETEAWLLTDTTSKH
jgi:uncharacterized membrane protein YgaE (UPF0421/DUF939 family)